MDSLATQFNGGAIDVYAGGVVAMKGRSSIINSRAKQHGGAIAIADFSVVAVTGGCSIINVSSQSGGALFLEGGTLEMSGSNIMNSTASVNGGAMSVTSGASSVIITGASNIINCDAGNFGGIHLLDGSVLMTNGSSMINSAAWIGGAFYVVGGRLTISTGSKIVASTAGHTGGAMHISGGRVTVEGRSSILNSSCSLNEGGAIYLNGGSVKLIDSHVASSRSAAGGGFLFLAGGELLLTNTSIENSTSDNSEGAIVYVPPSTTGTGPLLLTTFSEFRQRVCSGSLINQLGVAQLGFRTSTFTGCSSTFLASPTAFVGLVTTRGCGETYRDAEQRSWGTCSSDAGDACFSQPMGGTPLQSLTCRCPFPQYADPVDPDTILAPYRRAGGCVDPVRLTDVL
eukprot:7337234-Prymnesium_polylepis.1